MRLRVRHTTTYDYDSPITEGYTELRLKPLDSGGQRCLSFTVETDPGSVVHRYSDRHGNDVRHFDVLAPHARLVVEARSEVATPEVLNDEQTELLPLQHHDFLAPSPRAPFTDEVRAFATPCLVPGDPDTTMKRIVEAVRTRLRYEPGATDVDTDAAQALAHGSGVCQDFAHLAMAACRLGGLPARYVSGYVYAPGDASAAASHAWVDVFVAGRGWVSFDPTHDTAQTPRHVRVAVGRDYADVPPTRGVYKGSAGEKLEVTVSVEVL
ncbi:MAG TPA: transglutaminase family protein [Vicinamibacteria bacterium]